MANKKEERTYLHRWARQKNICLHCVHLFSQAEDVNAVIAETSDEAKQRGELSCNDDANMYKNNTHIQVKQQPNGEQ